MYKMISDGMQTVIDTLSKLGREDAQTPEVSLAAGFATMAVAQADSSLSEFLRSTGEKDKPRDLFEGVKRGLEAAEELSMHVSVDLSLDNWALIVGFLLTDSERLIEDGQASLAEHVISIANGISAHVQENYPKPESE